MFDQKIEEMIEQVQKPARYTGGEMNTAIKPWGGGALRLLLPGYV